MTLSGEETCHSCGIIPQGLSVRKLGELTVSRDELRLLAPAKEFFASLENLA